MATENYFWASDQAGSKDLIFLLSFKQNQPISIIVSDSFYLGIGEKQSWKYL